MSNKGKDLAAVKGGDGGVFVADDDGHIHWYDDSIVEELKRQGIIYQSEGRWRINNEDVRVIETRLAHLAACDFCKARPVTWNVVCDTFVIERVKFISRGDWAACRLCGEAISRRDVEGLLRRIFSRHEEQIWPELIEMMVMFWGSYKSITQIPAKPFGH